MSETPERVFLAKSTSGRLCDFGERYGEEYVRADLLAEAERKLAKAVSELESAADDLDDYSALTGRTIQTSQSRRIRTTIAELTGGKDE